MGRGHDNLRVGGTYEQRMTTNTFLMIHGGVYQKGRYNRIHRGKRSDKVGHNCHARITNYSIDGELL